MEVVGLQVMNDETSVTAKSVRNFHTFLLYLGKENYETLKNELADAVPKIKKAVKMAKYQLWWMGKREEWKWRSTWSVVLPHLLM